MYEMMTKEIRKTEPKTFQDLIDMDYKVFYIKHYRTFYSSLYEVLDGLLM
jgi:inorganic pyrophosphatase/exopolyphosphatase